MSKRKPNKPKDQNEAGRKADAPGLGAYFLSLEVENVRCFSERQTLDLSDGHDRPARWTILLGENGVGKTTILQLLAGLQFDTTRPNLRPDLHGYPNVYHFIGNMTLFHLFHAGMLARQRNEDDGRNGISELNVRTIHEMNFLTNNNVRFFTYSMIKSGRSVSTLVPSPSPVPIEVRCYAYGVGRRSSAGSLTEEGSDAALTTLFDEEYRLRNPEEWLLQLDYSVSKQAHARGRQEERLEQVKELLIEVLPDVSAIRFDAGSGVVPKPKVEFQTPYGWVPLGSLGYGYKTMIAWVVDLVSRMVERYPASADPLAEPAIVLVDEIDLHLHPQWQRKLIAYLTERFPNTQFIVTAHSPLIVQAAIDANFALLRREGDHVVIDNDVEPMPGATIEQILTSELFGLQSLRPPQLDRPLARRRELLTKAKLSRADQEELNALEQEIGPLPVGDTHDEAKKMMELVEESQRLLREREGRKP